MREKRALITFELDNRFFLMLGQADMRENYTAKKIKFLMNMHVFYFKKMSVICKH